MKILVTGQHGQVVSAMREIGALSGHEILTVGRPEFDLLHPESVQSVIEQAAPDVIVSAAAYTAVDKAEDEPELAYATNAQGAEAIAKAARQLHVPLIHLSTDYIFDGKLDRPYVEADPSGPTGVYGASKLAGERAIFDNYQDNSVILRVAWVYSPFGNNFVKTMLRLAGDRDEISVVADQIGNPTSALDIAAAVLRIADNLIQDSTPELRGVFHMTGQGEASWAEFAEAIFALSAQRGGPSANVKPISTADYPTRAKRPQNSRLDCSHLERVHGVALPMWTDSVAVVISKLVPERA